MHEYLHSSLHAHEKNLTTFIIVITESSLRDSSKAKNLSDCLSWCIYIYMFSSIYMYLYNKKNEETKGTQKKSSPSCSEEKDRCFLFSAINKARYAIPTTNKRERKRNILGYDNVYYTRQRRFCLFFFQKENRPGIFLSFYFLI